RLAPGERSLAVGRHRELEQHLRPARLHPSHVARMGPRRLLLAKPGVDRDAAFAPLRVALPRDHRVRILQRGNHARDPGADDGVSAWRGLAMVRTWLERHV